MVLATRNGKNCINIICEDTDVFLILLYYSKHIMIRENIQWIMSPLSTEKSVDIGKSAEALGNDYVKDILKYHALTGADSTCSYFGLGKMGPLKIFLKRCRIEFTRKNSL